MIFRPDSKTFAHGNGFADNYSKAVADSCCSLSYHLFKRHIDVCPSHTMLNN